jgi:hypothetical protein
MQTRRLPSDLEKPEGCYCSDEVNIFGFVPRCGVCQEHDEKMLEKEMYV